MSRTRCSSSRWILSGLAPTFAPECSRPESAFRRTRHGQRMRCLGGYLAARDPRFEGTLRWMVEQGFEMGRPSILEVEAGQNGRQRDRGARRW